MKKILIGIVSVILLVSMLGSCALLAPSSGGDTEITDPSQTEKFENQGITLSLPGDFQEENGVFFNDNYKIRIAVTEKSTITPNEGTSFPTLKEFYSTSVIFKDGLNFYTQDGILCADYVTTGSNITSGFAIDSDEATQFFAFFENESYFYVVAVYSEKLDYDTVKEQAAEWMQAVEGVDKASNTPGDETPADPGTNNGTADDQDKFEYSKITVNDQDMYKIVGIKDGAKGDFVVPSYYNGLPVYIDQYVFPTLSQADNARSLTVSSDVALSIGSLELGKWLKSLTYSLEWADFQLWYLFAPRGTSDFEFQGYYLPSSLQTIHINGGEQIPDRYLSFGVNDREDEYIYENIKTVIIENGITKIGYSAFYRCIGLQNITLPDSLTIIDRSAFASCRSLVNIELPNGITEIGQSAFASCSSLVNVTLPNGIAEIAGWTFYNCSSLVTVTIPSTVCSIGYGAFMDCTSLKVINFEGTMAEWKNISKETGESGSFKNCGDFTVNCTDGIIKD